MSSAKYVIPNIIKMIRSQISDNALLYLSNKWVRRVAEDYRGFQRFVEGCNLLQAILMIPFSAICYVFLIAKVFKYTIGSIKLKSD